MSTPNVIPPQTQNTISYHVLSSLSQSNAFLISSRVRSVKPGGVRVQDALKKYWLACKLKSRKSSSRTE
nr:hypothetical protein [Tanacetum cinerariifolium]